jgi:hypothetical protein
MAVSNIFLNEVVLTCFKVGNFRHSLLEIKEKYENFRIIGSVFEPGTSERKAESCSCSRRYCIESGLLLGVGNQLHCVSVNNGLKIINW